jgi:ubiquinone/menaquinone biosynthesis C-methylase UbiE
MSSSGEPTKRQFNNPASQNQFQPRQAVPPTADTYVELTGNAFPDLGALSLSCVAPIADGAIIHDNGCGAGAVTSTILTREPRLNVTIKATDIDERALSILRETTTEKKWNVEITKMDSKSLTYPDNTFTHSIGNALLFAMPGGQVEVVKEAYRTLKPGGVFITNSFAHAPNLKPMQETAKKTRPPGTPLPRAGDEVWSKPEKMRDTLVEGGFDSDRVVITQKTLHTMTTVDFDRYVTLFWSIVGGTGASGWLQSDDDGWDETIKVLKEEMLKEGTISVRDDGVHLEFLANIVVATK